jgi:chemotaxis signal transduction protein
VFDAAPEFVAMLRGALGDKQDVHALFVDRAGKVIASTDPSRPVGALLDIDSALLRLAKGASASRIVLHDGHYAIVGCSASSGYREFKVSDGYREDVIAVVYDLFGEVRERGAVVSRADTVLEAEPGAGATQEFASFFIDGMLFALPAASVLEALPASEIAPVSIGGRAERIGVLSQQRVGESRRFVWVFDLRHLMRGKPSEIRNSSQVIIVRHAGQDIGLLVDELHGVPEFGAAQIVPTPFATDADGLLVKQVIQANGGRLLIQALDVAQLFACLKDPSLPTVLDLGDIRRLIGGSCEQTVEMMGEAA